MFKTKLHALVLSCVLAASATVAINAHAANVVWVRNITITSVSDTDGYIQVGIVHNGTIDWLSMSSASANAAPAARFLASATAAWLAGKKLDAKVDFDNTTGCGTGQANCENVLGWTIKN